MQPIQPKISYMAEMPHLKVNDRLEEIVHSHINPRELIEKIESMDLYQVILNICQLKMDIASFQQRRAHSEVVLFREIEFDKQLIKLLKHKRDLLVNCSAEERKSEPSYVALQQSGELEVVDESFTFFSQDEVDALNSELVDLPHISSDGEYDDIDAPLPSITETPLGSP